MIKIIIAMCVVMTMIAVRTALAVKRYPVLHISDPSTLDLKSGDLVMFRHDNMGVMTKYIFGDEFGHIGIVYRDGRTGVLYVLESNPAADFDDFFGNKKSGPRITPLYTRLSTYRGRVYIKPLNRPLDAARQTRFDAAIDRYLAQDFSVPWRHYIANCVLMLNHRYDGSAHCSLFIARVLQDIGVIEMVQNEVCMRPQCFSNLYMHTRPLDNYTYGAISELTFQ